MTISFKTMFDVHAYASLKQKLQTLEQKLKEHLHLVADHATVTAQFEEGIAHLTGELKKVEAEIHPQVIAHLEEGTHPEVAIQQGLAGHPTHAQQEAAAAAAKAESDVKTVAEQPKTA